MSWKGIHKASEVFSTLQNAGIELIREGSNACATPAGKQDILLGHMMRLGTDAMKAKFMEIVGSNAQNGKMGQLSGKEHPDE